MSLGVHICANSICSASHLAENIYKSMIGIDKRIWYSTSKKREPYFFLATISQIRLIGLVLLFVCLRGGGSRGKPACGYESVYWYYSGNIETAQLSYSTIV